MYKYFVPDASETEKISMAQAPSVNLLRDHDIVPLYNEQGKIVLFIGVSFQQYIPIQAKLQGIYINLKRLRGGTNLLNSDRAVRHSESMGHFLNSC